MAWQELPQFMTELRANGSLSARTLEFTILTAVFIDSARHIEH